MNPKMKNNILLVVTFIGLFASFIGLLFHEGYRLWWLIMFSLHVFNVSILLDRRENLRKGWRA